MFDRRARTRLCHPPHAHVPEPGRARLLSRKRSLRALVWILSGSGIERAKARETSRAIEFVASNHLAGKASAASCSLFTAVRQHKRSRSGKQEASLEES